MTQSAPHITPRMRWRAVRKAFFDTMPWTSRKRQRKQIEQVAARESQLAALLMAPCSPAAAAQYSLQIPFSQPTTDELCLFVTHAASRELKPHVIHHIESLLDEGIAVLLIANTDDTSQQLSLPESLKHRLTGCMLRQNIGYDFAAWSHAYALFAIPTTIQRLYLINDSIVGPLSTQHFYNAIEFCRKSPEDLLGLTENHRPQRHLQSFFLVINTRLLHSPTFANMMRSIVNLPTKQAVIGLYETHLTSFVMSNGFRYRALFNNPFSPNTCEDETILNWAGLIDRGFPYLKASVIRETSELRELNSRVPAEYISAVR